MDPTVTTTAPPGDMTLAARLAANAATTAERLSGDDYGDRQIAQTEAFASMALSLAEIAAVAATLANRQQSARPVDELSVSELYDAIAARLRVDGPRRGPEPAKPAETPRPDTYATERALVAAALSLAADDVASGGGPDSAHASLRTDLDAAAREHVAALDGPAAEDLSTGPRRLAVTATLDATPGPVDGMPWLALRIGAMDGKGVALVQAYDPATLAMQSAIVAGGCLYVCFRPGGHSRWTNVNTGAWLTDGDVPTDGVLVVDGAQLGGGA